MAISKADLRESSCSLRLESWRLLPMRWKSGWTIGVLAVLFVAAAIISKGVAGPEPAVVIPAPAFNDAKAAGPLQTAVLAGGCFWGVQAVYQHVRGVRNAVS